MNFLSLHYLIYDSSLRSTLACGRLLTTKGTLEINVISKE